MPEKTNIDRTGAGVPNTDGDRKRFPRLQLLRTMQGAAAEMIAAREKAAIIHGVNNIRACGDLVETAVRDVLKRRIPSRYYIGQGHIINPVLATSPQCDVIIANKDSFPVLFQDDNGTEWFPQEAVYSVGEIKSSYDKSKAYIETFSEKIRRAKTDFNWQTTSLRVTEIGAGSERSHRMVDIHQLFSFMVFVNSDGLNPDDLEEFYRETPLEYLPNVVYLVDKGLILNMKFGGKDGRYPMEMNVYPEIADKIGRVQYSSKWCMRLFRDDHEELGLGMAFFTFYYLLMSHLSACNLGPPSLLAYYALASNEMGPRMHFHLFGGS